MYGLAVMLSISTRTTSKPIKIFQENYKNKCFPQENYENMGSMGRSKVMTSTLSASELQWWQSCAMTCSVPPAPNPEASIAICKGFRTGSDMLTHLHHSISESLA